MVASSISSLQKEPVQQNWQVSPTVLVMLVIVSSPSPTGDARKALDHNKWPGSPAFSCLLNTFSYWHHQESILALPAGHMPIIRRESSGHQGAPRVQHSNPTSSSCLTALVMGLNYSLTLPVLTECSNYLRCEETNRKQRWLIYYYFFYIKNKTTAGFFFYFFFPSNLRG